ncbi:MAG: hypothetical protein PVF54_07170, partial [Anaerolineae bacterium]
GRIRDARVQLNSLTSLAIPDVICPLAYSGHIEEPPTIGRPSNQFHAVSETIIRRRLFRAVDSQHNEPPSFHVG